MLMGQAGWLVALQRSGLQRGVYRALYGSNFHEGLSTLTGWALAADLLWGGYGSAGLLIGFGLRALHRLSGLFFLVWFVAAMRPTCRATTVSATTW